ncbi:MAG: phospholipase D-like domain-containing protein, partial [Bdellovibrionota bacterium]
ALRRGRRVRIIQEPTTPDGACAVANGTGSDSTCVAARAFAAQVRTLGGTYLPFNKKLCGGGAASKCLEHGKMLIVDGTSVLLSTGNLDETNLCDVQAGARKCNRDYSFVSDDSDLVEPLQNIFDGDLVGVPYDLQSIIADIPRLTVSPFSLQPLVDFIDHAQATLQIDNQYLKQDDLNRAILRAAIRGVKVEVTVASVCSFGPPSDRDAEIFEQTYSGFEAVGISVRAFNSDNQVAGMPGYMHAKVMVRDGNAAWVGSVNGSNMATLHNREFGVFLSDRQEILSLSEELLRDHHDPDSETWQDSLECRENDGEETQDTGIAALLR